jgi:hypothetical protein
MEAYIFLFHILRGLKSWTCICFTLRVTQLLRNTTDFAGYKIPNIQTTDTVLKRLKRLNGFQIFQISDFKFQS